MARKTLFVSRVYFRKPGRALWTAQTEERRGEERDERREETEGSRQHTGAGREDSAESGSSIYNAVRELRDGENMRRCWHVLWALNN